MLEPYYENNGMKIFHGDSREILPELFKRESIDHVVTDPPYSERTHQGARTNRLDAIDKRLIDFQSMSCEEIRNTLSICGPNMSGWVVAFMDWRYMRAIEEKPPHDLRFVRFGIWNKTNGMPQLTGDRPAMGWEAIAILHRANTTMSWNGKGTRSVWSAAREAFPIHPAQNPIGLVRSLITLFCKEGTTVLDPFMGSGTTLRAAKDLGCKAIGIEIDERYCELAANRLAQETLQFSAGEQ